MKVIIPSVEEIIEINKKLGKKVMNRGAVEFLMAKIESKYKNKEYKCVGDLVYIAEVKRETKLRHYDLLFTFSPQHTYKII